MKLNKQIVMTFIIMFLRVMVFCRTELEDLWSRAGEYSSDIYSSSKDAEYSRYLSEHSLLLYPLALNVSGKRLFYRNYSQYPDDLTVFTGTALFNQSLPGNLSVGLGGNYNIDRGYMQYDYIKGYYDTGYKDAVSLQMSLTQSLNPYWLHGQWRDPQKELMKIYSVQSNYNKDLTKSNVIKSVTNNYIQYRRLSRLIELTSYMLEIQGMNIDAMREMKDKGNLAAADIWNAENERTGTLNNLTDYLEQQKSIYITLCSYCGTFGAVSAEKALPDSYVRILDYDPVKENLALELDRLKKQNLVDNQNAAPSLSIEGEFSESTKMKRNKGINLMTDNNYLSYGVTVSVNFSDLYPGSSRARKKKYQIEKDKYNKQIQTYNAQYDEEKKYYEKIIAMYESDFEKTQEVYERNKEKYKAYEQMYKKGMCSRMELLSAEGEMLNAQCNVCNMSDMLWYTRWIQAQFID